MCERGPLRNNMSQVAPANDQQASPIKDEESQEEEASLTMLERLLNTLRGGEDIKTKPLPPLPSRGYRKVAHQMAVERSTWPIFRRFGALNMLNLLSYQAELMKLHQRLTDACEVDDEESDDTKLFAFCVEKWSEPDSEGGGLHDSWATMLDIRKTLKEYSKSSETSQ
jgi:hypothetical protein